MQICKWLLGSLLLSVSGSVAAAGVTILTPDNVNDEVKPLFSVVAEAFIDKGYEGKQGSVELSICQISGDPGDTECDIDHDSFINVNCGEEATSVDTESVIILHNERRLKGWVCFTDLCKLVISAEVDLTGWGLVSDEKLKASVTVMVEDDLIGMDEKIFTVK